MGAGQGKTNRTQVRQRSQPRRSNIFPAHLNDLSEVKKGWQAFIARHNLTNVSVEDYYRRRLDGIDGVVAIAQELLPDLVAAGAVSLPSGATLDGLQIRKQAGYVGSYGRVVISGDVVLLETRNSRGRTRKALIADRPSDYFNATAAMASDELLSLAYSVADAIKEMFPRAHVQSAG